MVCVKKNIYFFNIKSDIQLWCLLEQNHVNLLSNDLATLWVSFNAEVKTYGFFFVFVFFFFPIIS